MAMMITEIRLVHCTLAAATLFVAGCSRSESTPQAVPLKPPPPKESAQPTLPPGHPNIDMSAQTLPPGTASDAPNPQWTVPKDWQEGKASSMRRASFVAKDADGQTADIAVTVFPGDVGGLLMNINRWRGQFGLGPVAPDEISGMTSDLEVDGAKATVVDFKGENPPVGKTQPQRVIVVTVPHAGNSWFFKMTGDAQLVEAQRTTFLQFVQSVKF
jgi:hypothetical protein